MGSWRYTEVRIASIDHHSNLLQVSGSLQLMGDYGSFPPFFLSSTLSWIVKGPWSILFHTMLALRSPLSH